MTPIANDKHHLYHHHHHRRYTKKALLKSSLLLCLFLTIMTSGVAAHGKLFVGFLSYGGHEHRDVTGSCCDGTEVNGECTESCDLIFQVSLIGLDGHYWTNRRLSNVPIRQSGDIIFSLPAFVEQTVNPVMFHFDHWQQDVKVSVQVFDVDFQEEESPLGESGLQLVDEIEYTVELTRQSEMYVCAEVKSLRRPNTRLKMALRYRCDSTYGGPVCGIDCLLTPWLQECPTWQDHGQPSGFNGIASQASHYFGNPLARCPLKPMTPAPTRSASIFTDPTTIHQPPTLETVSTPYFMNVSTYSGIKSTTIFTPSGQQTLSHFTSSVIEGKISKSLSTLYSSRSLPALIPTSVAGIEYTTAFPGGSLTSTAQAGSLLESHTLTATLSSPNIISTMSTTGDVSASLIRPIETTILPSVVAGMLTPILPSVMVGTLITIEDATVRLSQSSFNVSLLSPSETMTFTPGQPIATRTIVHTSLGRDSVQATTHNSLHDSELTSSFGEVTSESDVTLATTGPVSTPYLSDSITQSSVTSDTFTSSQIIQTSGLCHSATQRNTSPSTHTSKPTQTENTYTPSKPHLVEPISEQNNPITPKDGGVKPSYTTALPNTSDDEDQDPMQYWGIIVGSVLGGLAMVATIGYIIYRSRQRALQKRQEIYTVTPQMMSTIEENGTSGRSDVPMTTALL